MVPIKGANNNDLALLEIASPRPHELNSVSQTRLKDIIPVFEAAVKRTSEEHQNILEATIQEHYTTIHPTVKWRFYEAAEKYHNDSFNSVEKPKLDAIVFENGEGVKQDYGEAIRLYKLAVDQGNLFAQCNLAYMYEKGYGVEQDYGEAIRLYKLAVDHGYGF